MSSKCIVERPDSPISTFVVSEAVSKLLLSGGVAIFRLALIYRQTNKFVSGLFGHAAGLAHHDPAFFGLGIPQDLLRGLHVAVAQPLKLSLDLGRKLLV
jgi:hypothetical protein